MSRGLRILRAALSVLVGLGVPYLGWAWVFGFQPPIGWPFPVWVKICIPFSVLGPDQPSAFAFWSLLVLNCLLWFSLAYGVFTFTHRALSRKHVHA
jgi:hypothetical protein